VEDSLLSIEKLNFNIICTILGACRFQSEIYPNMIISEALIIGRMILPETSNISEEES
jgi:hypothetical protein